MNLQELPQEIKNVILAVYEGGYWDRDAKLMLFNNEQTEAEKLEYLQDYLFYNNELRKDE